MFTITEINLYEYGVCRNEFHLQNKIKWEEINKGDEYYTLDIKAVVNEKVDYFTLENTTIKPRSGVYASKEGDKFIINIEVTFKTMDKEFVLEKLENLLKQVVLDIIEDSKRYKKYIDFRNNLKLEGRKF